MFFKDFYPEIHLELFVQTQTQGFWGVRSHSGFVIAFPFNEFWPLFVLALVFPPDWQWGPQGQQGQRMNKAL